MLPFYTQESPPPAGFWFKGGSLELRGLAAVQENPADECDAGSD